MLRKILLISAAGLFVFAMSKLSFAMMCGDHSGSQQLPQAHSEHERGTTEASKEAVSEAVNVGNKICPVSGEKVGEGGMELVAYEYEGKIYNFCCASCVDEFKKDPGKYIKKVDEELQAESKGQSDHEKHGMEMMQGPGTSHQGTHQGHQH
ncbi:MAG: YHS domain-containing protein [Candidatus Omnitrophota bacterium]